MFLLKLVIIKIRLVLASSPFVMTKDNNSRPNQKRKVSLARIVLTLEPFLHSSCRHDLGGDPSGGRRYNGCDSGHEASPSRSHDRRPSFLGLLAWLELFLAHVRQIGRPHVNAGRLARSVHPRPLCRRLGTRLPRQPLSSQRITADRRTMGQNQVSLRHQKFTFPRARE